MASACGLVAAQQPTTLVPGDQAPSFMVPTLAGNASFSAPAPPMGVDGTTISIGLPMLIVGYDSQDGLTALTWSNETSLDSLLTVLPNTTHLVIASYAAEATDAVADVTSLRDRLMARAQALGWSTAQQTQFFSRMHFVTESVASMSNWIPGYLASLPSSVDWLLATGPDGYYMSSPREDSYYTWLAWPSFTNATIIDGGNGCGPASKKMAGKLVLVSLNTTNPACSVFEQAVIASQSGALGLVIYPAGADQGYVELNCYTDEECNTVLTVTASMIPHTQGMMLQKAIAQYGDDLRIAFPVNSTAGFFGGVDTNGQLVEIGWQKYPSLMTLVWEAQWLVYTQALYANLSKPAMTFDIFDWTILEGKTGIVSNVILPDPSTLQFASMELDMALSCPGTTDETCPSWDHTLQLFVCCYEPNGEEGPYCGQELGRWISPFRRRVGRWLTEVSPFMPLLTSSNCTFTMMNTAWWQHAWKPQLRLRFSQPVAESTPMPSGFVPLFQGGVFNSTYNSKYTPITFTTPSTGVAKAELVAVITGHGSDNNNCAEFCVTSHHFNVNGQLFVWTFHDAGTPFGCADHVLDGVEPNEHGTWVYGRDGWCDGQDVKPLIYDITDVLAEAGQVNNVSYFGWFNGTTPHPTHDPGLIIMYSHVVFYH